MQISKHKMLLNQVLTIQIKCNDNCANAQIFIKNSLHLTTVILSLMFYQGEESSFLHRNSGFFATLRMTEKKISKTVKHIFSLHQPQINYSRNAHKWLDAPHANQHLHGNASNGRIFDACLDLH